MRILIICAAGKLGQDLCVGLTGHEVFPLAHSDIDIGDLSGLRTHVVERSPEVIINTAAFHKVEVYETEVMESFAVNAAGVHNVVRVANKADAAMVHFSTDYVFDGRKRIPYTEADLPNPLSIYGISKLDGEWILRH